MTKICRIRQNRILCTHYNNYMYNKNIIQEIPHQELYVPTNIISYTTNGSALSIHTYLLDTFINLTNYLFD